jgi:hypothetical protein
MRPRSCPRSSSTLWPAHRSFDNCMRVWRGPSAKVSSRLGQGCHRPARGRRIRADRIGRDHAVARHQEDVAVKEIAERINAIGHLGSLEFCRRRCCRRGRRRGGGRLAERGLGNQRNARRKQQRPGRPCVCFRDTTPLPCVSLEGLAGELRRLGLKMASNLLVDPALELSSQIKNL